MDNYRCGKVGLVVGLLIMTGSGSLHAQNRWPVHAMDRPRPPVVDPGPEQPPAPPPADAIVLFNGRDLSEWAQTDDAPAAWLVRDGYMEIVPQSGSIRTRRGFGDVQLHIEWAAPAQVRGEGQGRGNSGVFLMNYYEIQVLDSYRNDTYADGQAGAAYGQVPPLVNATRPPGQWNTYDIVFHRPHFNADGSLASPGRITVLHNGILIHDETALRGRTVHQREAGYSPHEDRLPILLQDHGDRVRFRNVWIRDLER